MLEFRGSDELGSSEKKKISIIKAILGNNRKI